MKPFRSRPRFPLHPSLALLAIAGALGGITLMTQPSPRSRPAPAGGPRGVATPVFVTTKVQKPAAGGVATALPALEDVGPTDRCVVEAPQVDDPFVRIAPEVDDRFFVKPLVQGLPAASSPTNR